MLQMLMGNSNNNLANNLGWNSNFQQIGFPNLLSKSQNLINNPIPQFRFPSVDIVESDIIPAQNLLQQAKRVEAANITIPLENIRNRKETDASDKLKNEIKELKELTEEANKTIKPKVEEDLSITCNKVKEGKKTKMPEESIQKNLRNNDSANPKISANNEENQMKSEFDDKFEYLLDKLNIINRIISLK
jgi:hypothetical protein